MIIKASSAPLLSAAVIKIGSMIHPPPYLRKDMEFKYGAWAGTSTAKGSDGRYLGEDNASPEFYSMHLPTTYHICKFGDSRDGKQYNMTALHDMMKLWPEIMTLINRFREYYKQVFKIDYNDFTPVDLFVFSKLLIGTTSFLIRSVHFDFEDGNIPIELTSQNKLTAGVFMVGRKMIERGDTFFSDSEAADGEFLYKYADKYHVLISPRDKEFACAGSIRKIIELIDVTIKGWDSEPAELPEHLLEILDENYKSAFEYGIKDLHMELTFEYAEVIILEAVLTQNTDWLNPNDKHAILEQVASGFPDEFLHPDIIPNHKQNLELVFNKLGIKPVEPLLKAGNSTTFEDFYINYLGQLRSYSLHQQNEINTLLGIERLNDISLNTMNKRLGLLPNKYFKSINQ